MNNELIYVFKEHTDVFSCCNYECSWLTDYIRFFGMYTEIEYLLIFFHIFSFHCRYMSLYVYILHNHMLKVIQDMS